MYRLSVCADSCFRQLPFKQRVERIVSAEFLMDFWGWTNRDVDWLAADPQFKSAPFPDTLADPSYIRMESRRTWKVSDARCPLRKNLPVASCWR